MKHGNQYSRITSSASRLAVESTLSTQSASHSSVTVESVSPVFIKDRDLGDSSITPIDVCCAMVNTIGSNRLTGVQRINNLWRVYLKDRATRLQQTLCKQITINGKQVSLYDKNPNSFFTGLPHTTKTNNDKLTVKNLPLSMSNKEIEKLSAEKNVTLLISFSNTVWVYKR